MKLLLRDSKGTCEVIIVLKQKQRVCSARESTKDGGEWETDSKVCGELKGWDGPEEVHGDEAKGREDA